MKPTSFQNLSKHRVCFPPNFPFPNFICSKSQFQSKYYYWESFVFTRKSFSASIQCKNKTRTKPYQTKLNKRVWKSLILWIYFLLMKVAFIPFNLKSRNAFCWVHIYYTLWLWLTINVIYLAFEWFLLNWQVLAKKAFFLRACIPNIRGGARRYHFFCNFIKWTSLRQHFY